MVEQNNCSGMQKILFVLMIVLGVAVYVGMPWAYRYAQESYNTTPHLLLQTAVRPVFLFLLGDCFVWLMMRAAGTSVALEKKAASWMRVTSLALLLVYEVWNASFWLKVPSVVQGMLAAFRQPYQNLVQSDSYLFVLLGVMFYFGLTQPRQASGDKG